MKKILQKIIFRILNCKIFFVLPDNIYLYIKYFFKIGEKLNLRAPETFNEKLQWLKLNDRKPIYTKMVDKYEAKKFVADKIGEEYIIPTIGIYNSFEDINFDVLPEMFVLKCTHDSGGLCICKDKKTFNKEDARKKIKKTFRKNYFYNGREWPYKNVVPRIIIEKYMVDESNTELNDYKFFCFNGKVKIILVCSNRFNELEETFFDEEWNLLSVKRPNRKINSNIRKPLNFEKMKILAEKLSKDISFIRVDFYECDKKIYFGELTFFPASGFKKFEPEEWDKKIGNLLNLPNQ